MFTCRIHKVLHLPAKLLFDYVPLPAENKNLNFNIVEKYIFQVFWSEESQCTELFGLVNGLTPIKQIHQKKEAINF